MAAHRPKARPLLGIDISATAIKLIELSRRVSGYRVESHATVELSAGAVVDGQINDIEAVGNAIRRAARKARTNNRHAAIAVASSAAITRVVTLPQELSDDEMEQQVLLEADQHVPYPSDEVSVDFEVIGPSANEADMVDVLLVAARNDNINTRISALEIAGLTPVVVDVENYALENASLFLAHQIPDQGQGKTVALIDVGATTTTFTVLHDRKTIYSREQTFGSQQLTEEIAGSYDLSVEDAESASRTGSVTAQTDAGYQPFMEDLLQMIERSLQLFYSSNSQHSQIDHVLLAGGCTAIGGIDAAVAERVGIATVIAAPFENMSVAGRARSSVLKQEGPSLLIACGLALRGFD